MKPTLRFTLCFLFSAGLATTALGQLGMPIEPILETGSTEPVGGSPKIVPGVPSYTWFHGCGPTALGMMIGFWDARGFDDLIEGSSDWDANRDRIKSVIASPGHIRDYYPQPDRTPTPEDPYHADDCLADFCYASRQPDKAGWSYFHKQDDGLREFAEFRDYYDYDVSQTRYSSGMLWDEFVAEIDAGRPAEFLVDTDGDDVTDHFVTAIGYDDTPGREQYACYNTWDRNVHWYDFGPTGQDWGVYGGTFFEVVPEPASFFLAAVGAVTLLGYALGRRGRASGRRGVRHERPQPGRHAA